MLSYLLHYSYKLIVNPIVLLRNIFLGVYPYIISIFAILLNNIYLTKITLSYTVIRVNEGDVEGK